MLLGKKRKEKNKTKIKIKKNNKANASLAYLENGTVWFGPRTDWVY